MTQPPHTLGFLFNVVKVNCNDSAGRKYFTASALKSKQAKKIAAAADFVVFFFYLDWLDVL